MIEPGSSQSRQRVRSEIVAAIATGVLVGGWAGVVIRGSGMFYSNLILAGCLLVVLVIVGLGALAAGLTGRETAARALAGFVGVTVISTTGRFADTRNTGVSRSRVRQNAASPHSTQAARSLGFAVVGA